jgi:predicted TIM-barrel fold metal-dependent hydrolase
MADTPHNSVPITMKIIDPHLHLFDLDKGDYHWLKTKNPPFWSDKSVIAKSFSVADIALSSPLILSGFVHIEAGFDNLHSWREIAWLEDNCQASFRSIAMLDITLAPVEFSKQLDKLTSYKSVVGIRHILDDEALVILKNENCLKNLRTLAKEQLSFEVQMALLDTEAVECLIEMINLTPSLLYCINHAGWPPIDDMLTSSWLKNLARLSEFSNLYIKCSGYEMSDRTYSAHWRYDIIQQCIASFGIERVMLASNFPLCLWHASYQKTWSTNSSTEKNENQRLNINDLTLLCYQNAHKFYKF